MKKAIPVIVFLGLALGLAGFGIFYRVTHRTKFNNSYVNGNTAGNLYNGGLFCEHDGTVFFANPSDHDRLYAMNYDGTNLRKLCDDIVTYINADDNYVYYVRTNPRGTQDFAFLNITTDSLCRIDRDGGSPEIILDEDPCMYASLVGDYIYYIHYDEESHSSLYRIKIDGSGKEQVSEQPYFTCSAQGQYIYHNGLENDHYIWQLDTSTNKSRMIYKGNCWMPDVKGSVAYFMDCDNNYALACAGLTDNSVTLLSRDRLDCYNVAGNYIYYQRNDPESPALCRIRTDGTEFEVVAEGNYTHINATSRYIYFEDYSSGTIYYTSTTPGGPVNMFIPGTGANVSQ